MGTYRAWYLSLAAFLLVAGPLPAQAQDEHRSRWSTPSGKTQEEPRTP